MAEENWREGKGLENSYEREFLGIQWIGFSLTSKRETREGKGRKARKDLRIVFGQS